MGVKVVVREGESIASALCRLRRAAFFAQRRAWYKGSRGFHEKPSRKRHKREYIDRLKGMGDGQFRDLYMNQGVAGQLRRSEPLLGVFGRGGDQSWARRKAKRRPAEPDAPADGGGM
jgi:ribosomal protein S21